MWSDSSLFFHECSLHHNQISGSDLSSGTLQGGAVVADRIVAIHTSFRNHTIQRGSSGSIVLQGGVLAADTMQLTTCSFRFNRIVSSGSGSTVAHGGALAIIKQSTSGALLLTNSLFYQNELVGSGLGSKLGGAIFFTNPVDTPNRVPLQIRNSSFLSNRVAAASGIRRGGALYSEEGNVDPLLRTLFLTTRHWTMEVLCMWIRLVQIDLLGSVEATIALSITQLRREETFLI
jgi:hypothetical protein